MYRFCDDTSIQALAMAMQKDLKGDDDDDDDDDVAKGGM